MCTGNGIPKDSSDYLFQFQAVLSGCVVQKVNTAKELMQNYDPANLVLHGKLKAICITLKEIIEVVKKIDLSWSNIG